MSARANRKTVSFQAPCKTAAAPLPMLALPMCALSMPTDVSAEDLKKHNSQVKAQKQPNTAGMEEDEDNDSEWTVSTAKSEVGGMLFKLGARFRENFEHNKWFVSAKKQAKENQFVDSFYSLVRINSSAAPHASELSENEWSALNPLNSREDEDENGYLKYWSMEFPKFALMAKLSPPDKSYHVTLKEARPDEWQKAKILLKARDADAAYDAGSAYDAERPKKAKKPKKKPKESNKAKGAR
jgi:hypothetical protein